MPRINIVLPENFIFSTELKIQQQQINTAGHLDNVQLIALMSDARQKFFESLGYSHIHIEGLGTVVTDTAVQYLSEAFEGEILVFDVATDDFNKYGCDLLVRVRDRATGREVARGKIGFVFFDYTTRRVARIPEPFLERVKMA